jgi:3-oxoacyl-[acyl-carrier protein] reductase
MRPILFLVSGVSSGIGFQVASDLLLDGNAVLGISRSKTDKVQYLLNKFGRLFSHECLDLVENIANLHQWILGQSKHRGPFKGMVHSAGIQQIIPIQSNTYKQMLDVFNLNLFSGLALARGIVDRRVIAEDGGSIVFISSIVSKTGYPGLVNYCASKAAVNGAMRAMASELAPRNIRVNSVLPGLVMTEMIEKCKDVYNQQFIDKARARYPLGIGSPKDISNVVCFLLNDKSRWITGSEIDVNGGVTLGA